MSEGRERILDAAERLFMERGYRSVSIRDIAQACEMTNAALYYHFDNKAALFVEVLQRYAERLRDDLRAAVRSQQGSRQQLELVLARFAELAEQREPAFFAMHRELKEVEGARALEQGRHLMHIILAPVDEILRDAAVRGETRALPGGMSPAALLFGMLQGAMIHQHACVPQELSVTDMQQIAQAVLDVFWDGLAVERVEELV